MASYHKDYLDSFPDDYNRSFRISPVDSLNAKRKQIEEASPTFIRHQDFIALDIGYKVAIIKDSSKLMFGEITGIAESRDSITVKLHSNLINRIIGRTAEIEITSTQLEHIELYATSGTFDGLEDMNEF